jgi:hypothetical protein
MKFAVILSFKVSALFASAVPRKDYNTNSGGLSFSQNDVGLCKTQNPCLPTEFCWEHAPDSASKHNIVECIGRYCSSLPSAAAAETTSCPESQKCVHKWNPAGGNLGRSMGVGSTKGHCLIPEYTYKSHPEKCPRSWSCMQDKSDPYGAGYCGPANLVWE